jgi:hypothetical protein
LFGNHSPYFNVAFTQLTRGLLLEENLVCIDAIRTGLTKLIPDDPRLAIEELRQANLWLTRDFTMGLAAFWGALKMPPPPNMQDRTWEQAEHWALLDRRVLKEFTHKTNHILNVIFWKTYESYREVHSEQTASELSAARQELYIRSHRLQTNVQLFSRALQLIGSDSREVKLDAVLLVGGFAPGAALSGIGLSQSQLHSFDFQKTDLSDADLESASLQAANLVGARLRQSNLVGANLEDANLAYTDLTDTKLFRAIMNNATDLSGTNWWQADFSNPGAEEVDTNLLRMLFERDGNNIPSDSDDLHTSVRAFAEKWNTA